MDKQIATKYALEFCGFETESDIQYWAGSNEMREFIELRDLILKAIGEAKNTVIEYEP